MTKHFRVVSGEAWRARIDEDIAAGRIVFIGSVISADPLRGRRQRAAFAAAASRAQYEAVI